MLCSAEQAYQAADEKPGGNGKAGWTGGTTDHSAGKGIVLLEDASRHEGAHAVTEDKISIAPFGLADKFGYTERIVYQLSVAL